MGAVGGAVGVRPSFLGFHRFMKALRDYADAGVQQPYEVPYLSERVLVNVNGLVRSLRAALSWIPENSLARFGRAASRSFLGISFVDACSMSKGFNFSTKRSVPSRTPP